MLIYYDIAVSKKEIAMRDTKPLEIVLRKKLGFNYARIKFMAIFLSIIFISKSVNLMKIAVLMPGDTNLDSKYKRCQRFLSKFEIEENKIANFLLNLYPGDKNKLYLVVDRTNWKFGKLDINILTLCIVYEGIAFPIIWTLLDNKGGSSNTKNRIDLIEKFISIFGKERIECLLCDREFIGNQWVYYLKNILKINFCIRIKEKEFINKKDGKKSHVKNFFRNLRKGETTSLNGRRLLWGHHLYIAGAKSEKGDLIIVITDKDKDLAIPNYIRRWEIETFFKCLKSSGFNLEDTHLRHLKRISNLFGLLAIAFCWAYLSGDLESKRKPIKIKKHGRKAKSVFRVGLDKLTGIVRALHEKIEEFKSVVRILSCT